MYNPRSLYLKNFGSYKEAIFEFQNGKAILISGTNETDTGQKSNGSGKSFLIEGLSYALLGSSLRKIKDSELVRDDEKQAEVTLFLENSVAKHTLSITRKIYTNSKSSELTIEGEANITSVNEGNQYILDKLGLTRDDILNYFLLSKERYTSFFNSSDTAKKELITRFSKANLIDTVLEEIESEKKSLEVQLTSTDNKLAALTLKKEALSSIDNSSEIERLKQEAEQEAQKTEQLEAYFEETLYKILDLQEEQVLVEAKHEEAKTKVEAIGANAKEFTDLLDEIERHLKNEVECPKCEHKFSLKDNKYSLEEAKHIYPEIKSSLEELSIESKIRKDELANLSEALRLSKQETQEYEFKAKSLRREVDQIQRTIKSNEERIERLTKADTTTSNLESLTIEEQELQIMKQTIQSQLSLETEWLLRFKRFKGWLANKSLKSIQDQANFYLEKLGSTLSVSLSGYTAVNNGKELREKISSSVYRNGSEHTFSRFSGGERARVEVAIILAMQRIINQSTDGKGLNLLVVDEILESVDSLGLEAILKSLNLLNINVLIITHATMDTNYENTVWIKKVDGESKIFQ